MTDERRTAIEEEPREGSAEPTETLELDVFDDAPEPGSAAASRDWSSWSNLWQVPAILLSVVLIALGTWVASQRAPENDFNAVLDEVDLLISTGRFDDAQLRLEGPMREHLDLATPAEQARYHATVADWLAEAQAAQGVSTRANNKAIVEQYERAEALGLDATADRLERWGNALIDLGEAERAQEHITELEALSLSTGGRSARLRRNRLLRRLVEFTLSREGVSYEAAMEELRKYRDDELLETGDLAWVVAREAELRIEAGEAAAAVDRLLVDMRRLENAEEPPSEATWSELYVILGRGFYDQGQYDNAEYHLHEALARADGAQDVRARALLYLGRIDVVRGEHASALERFDEVVRLHPDCDAYLPALLGRAEVRSIRGDHEQSLADYAEIVQRLEGTEPRRDISRRTVAASLADRHDAALTTGRLPLALRYVEVAESLFRGDDVPIDVLQRIASTSRQIADDIMSDAIAALPSGSGRVEEVDPETRAIAAAKFEKAGTYYLRHARALTAVPGSDRQWADSLWMSADSYDRAGRRDLAIRHFLEYIAGRSIDDPRRAEVMYRLARAYQAEMDYESAAARYAQVIDEHPRSPFGTRSHVPLARCYVALGREPEAEQQLVAVVDGRQGERTPIMPEAADYRDALIELGRLYHESGQYRAAVERLSAAADRYPDDPRINEIRFQLADSYRRLAHAVRAELDEQPTLPPEERQARAQQARADLERALDLFSMVTVGYGLIDEHRLNRLQRDAQRFASLYRGDCAFELGQYELAAEFYDQAARRYSDHHSSMHALVQIVNCYDRLGRTRDADIAHHNALIRLRQLPASAFDDPQALMDRDAWEQWLRNRPLGQLDGSETASPGEPPLAPGTTS